MDAEQISDEIVDAAERANDCSNDFYDCRCPDEDQLRRALAGAWPLIAGHVLHVEGDGDHTIDELYRYRMLYNAHAAAGWLAKGWPVVKSWRHADGQECFGGGWFIVTATLPTGQVSNHYQAEAWDLFDVPEVDLPPAWDGHTPAEAAERLDAAARLRTTPDQADAAPWKIRTNPDGSLDEVVATGARVHLEEMNHGQWWLGIDVGDRTLHVNFGVVNPRAKTYAHAEDASA